MRQSVSEEAMGVFFRQTAATPGIPCVDRRSKRTAAEYLKQKEYCRRLAALHKYRFDYFTRHVGKSISSAEVFERELFVVEAHAIKNGSMEIIYMNRIF